MSPGSLTPCPLPSAQRQGDRWQMTNLHVDRFGNLVTNLAEEDFAAISMSLAPGRVARRVATFGDGADDEVVLLVGSSGLLELVVNGGSAAAATGLGRGDVVDVRE
jgi:S-adenosylmethionine hydrolase